MTASRYSCRAHLESSFTLAAFGATVKKTAWTAATKIIVTWSQKSLIKNRTMFWSFWSWSVSSVVSIPWCELSLRFLPAFSLHQLPFWDLNWHNFLSWAGWHGVQASFGQRCSEPANMTGAESFGPIGWKSECSLFANSPHLRTSSRPTANRSPSSHLLTAYGGLVGQQTTNWSDLVITLSAQLLIGKYWTRTGQVAEWPFFSRISHLSDYPQGQSPNRTFLVPISEQHMELMDRSRFQLLFQLVTPFTWTPFFGANAVLISTDRLALFPHRLVSLIRTIDIHL